MATSIDNHMLSRVITGNAENVNWDTVQWKSLALQAQVEGVAPLLYWTISKQKNPAVPKTIQHFLRAAYAQTWMENQRIFKELEIIAQHFDQAGIPVVVLKGVCFALTIYPDVGLRPMGDLDVLVPSSKLNEAVEIAKALGYTGTLPDASPGLRDLLNHEVFLQKTDAYPLALEIHRSLIADRSFTYAVPVDWFWTQTESLNRTGFTNLLMLTPTAQLLYASAHIALQHGGKNALLRWYYDLDCLIRVYAERIDWDLLLSQAREFEWGSALNAALSQAQVYFDTPIPNNVCVELAALTDRHKKLVEMLKDKPATHILDERQKMATLNGYARIRLALALIIPSPTYMRWRYKLKTSWALPIYYPIRWWGILQDGIQTLSALVHGKFFS